MLDKAIKHTRYPDDMDNECVPMCDFFNNVGLKTRFSCCGHGVEGYVVIFDDSVSDADIEKFIAKCSHEKDYTPLQGKFSCWMRKCGGVMVENWMYEIPYSKRTISPMKRAKIDLDKMKRVNM